MARWSVGMVGAATAMAGSCSLPTLTKVQSGDSLNIPAATFNTFVDSARDYLQRQQGTGGKPTQAFQQTGIVPIKNASGADVGRFAVALQPMAIQLRKVAAVGDEFLVRAVLHDAALPHHVRVIGVAHGGKAVGDDQAGAILR